VGKELVHALKYKGCMRDVQKRGFQNQAGLMAEGVAERIGALTSDKLKVVRRTRDQVELSAEARLGNVAGAYASRGPVVGRILIVDDVFTTGATLGVCAKTLRKAGAREVHAPTLCRTV
jgi:competence protein ComFC